MKTEANELRRLPRATCSAVGTAAICPASNQFPLGARPLRVVVKALVLRARNLGGSMGMQ